MVGCSPADGDLPAGPMAVLVAIDADHATKMLAEASKRNLRIHSVVVLAPTVSQAK